MQRLLRARSAFVCSLDHVYFASRAAPAAQCAAGSRQITSVCGPGAASASDAHPLRWLGGLVAAATAAAAGVMQAGSWAVSCAHAQGMPGQNTATAPRRSAAVAALTLPVDLLLGLDSAPGPAALFELARDGAELLSAPAEVQTWEVATLARGMALLCGPNLQVWKG
jgi:hypothetical protein